MEWRRRGIGASDVPAILGESEYKSVNDIWLDKVGLAPEQEQSWAMRRGTEAEPKIRALYELHNDCDMPADLVVHPEHEIFRASLDGFNREQGLVLEIKYPGKEKHELAKSGVVPATYYGQVQFQLYVSGANRVDYVSYDGSGIAVVPVKKDQEYIDRMLPKLFEFWECVKTKTPPEPLKEKARSVEDNLFGSYAKAKAELDVLTKAVKILGDEIKKKYPKGGVHASGYELVLTPGRASVDYDSVPQLQGVDLSPYTKYGSPVLTLKPKKETK